jgi:hypothetical protein
MSIPDLPPQSVLYDPVEYLGLSMATLVTPVTKLRLNFHLEHSKHLLVVADEFSVEGVICNTDPPGLASRRRSRMTKSVSSRSNQTR